MTDRSVFLFRISDLLGKPGATRSVELSVEMPLEMDMAKVVSDVDVGLRFDATSREIVATGLLEFDAEATCTRCLTKINQRLSTKFSQIYGSPDPEDEDAQDVLPIGADGDIDLESPVRDEVGVALPLSPVCRDDCRGLCPTCGTDLNREPCDGHEDLSSSPFAVLQDFLDKD